MQLDRVTPHTPTRTAAAPLAPAGTPFDGAKLIATGNWMAPHGAPLFTAGWWTAGADLAAGAGWSSREEALAGARELSRATDGPVAVTMEWSFGDAGTERYQAHRIATGELVEGDGGWATPASEWLTSEMVRAPLFRGWTMLDFSLVGIANRGELMHAGTR